MSIDLAIITLVLRYQFLLGKSKSSLAQYDNPYAFSTFLTFYDRYIFHQAYCRSLTAQQVFLTY